MRAATHRDVCMVSSASSLGMVPLRPRLSNSLCRREKQSTCAHRQVICCKLLMRSNPSLIKLFRARSAGGWHGVTVKKTFGHVKAPRFDSGSSNGMLGLGTWAHRVDRDELPSQSPCSCSLSQIEPPILSQVWGRACVQLLLLPRRAVGSRGARRSTSS